MGNSIIDPIDVKSIVSKSAHPVEESKNVSLWFETEYIEINFGDTTGRPSSDVTLKNEYLAQFLQTGWTIDQVLEQGEGGSWVTVGGGRTTTKSQPVWVWSGQNNGDGFGSGLFDAWGDKYFSQAVSIKERSLEKNGNVSISDYSPSADAPAFWTAYQKIRLKRRRLVAERVMQSMMDSFTKAYNGGRGIEDGRYNEIVALYSIMLNRSENEGNAIVSGATDLMPLANRMAEMTLTSIEQADSSSDELAEKSTKNRVADVNRQFDALVATTKAQMITNGTYNNTVWPSTLAGIERQRSEALDKANEAGMTVKFNAKQSLSTLKSSVAAQLLTAMQGVASASDQRKITVVELRNQVLKWMLDYIGTREESYPELEEIATIAERMGFSVGSAGSVL